MKMNKVMRNAKNPTPQQTNIKMLKIKVVVVNKGYLKDK